MDAQNDSQNPQGVSQTLLLKLFKICTWHLTSRKSRRRCLENSTARKQLEAELGTNSCTLGGTCFLYTASLVSIQLVAQYTVGLVSPVQSSP